MERQSVNTKQGQVVQVEAKPIPNNKMQIVQM